MYGTAGGSGPIASEPQPTDSIISEPLTPESLPRVSRATFCKIKERLNSYFADVDLSPCRGYAFQNGMCRFFWLGGHIANSKGFSSLERMIGRRYWVSAKLHIDVGNYYGALFHTPRDSNSMLIEVTTLHSVYALMPPNRRPEPTRYHPIENDIPNLDADELDLAIALQVEDILSRGGPLVEVPCYEP
jgi:hypothetical protein